MRDSAKEEVPAVPAATVVLLRDGRAGLETLMVRRSSALDFAGGMWVFPGGRVDSVDHLPDRARDPARDNLPTEHYHELAAARRAAVREAREEVGLVVKEASLVPFSHWTPPAVSPRRFSTWFFIAEAPRGTVRVDGGEILDHAWLHPAEALERRDAGEIEIIPPTWITLHRLSTYPSVSRALADAANRAPEAFVTHMAVVPGGAVALYDGDAGYADSDPERPGRRHRLWMLAEGWRYETDGAQKTPRGTG